MKDGDKEKIKRFDFVFGVIIASIISFFINLLSNIYYDLFVNHSTSWDKIDHFQVYFILLILLALFGFLEFFISDYKNPAEVNQSLFIRYKNYFFYEFTPGKIIRIISGLYISLILLVILICVYFILAEAQGYIVTSSIFIFILFIAYLKEKKSMSR
jgi:hypothetical protein